jgi:hypothetical protein
MFGDDRSVPLTDEARELAELWMGLPEQHRTLVLKQVRQLSEMRKP